MVRNKTPITVFFHALLLRINYICFPSLLLGVKSIDANVETKTVVVEADDSVSPQLLLEKLQKVRSYHSSGVMNL